ncbi:MAG: CPBP family glutamic-type intramembrane protease [Acidobacteriaceae bacterium]
MTPERVVSPQAVPTIDTATWSRPADLHLVAAPATTASSAPARLLLLSEFLLLFIGIPLALFFRLASKLPPLPVLWLVAVFCFWTLWRDPTFDRRQLWNAAPLRQQLPQILALFFAGVAVVTILVHQYAPDLFLILLRTHPRAWAMIIAAYPIFSVYPQGLIYRVFFFHRYRPLLAAGVPSAKSVVALKPNASPIGASVWELGPQTRDWLMILVSAATFALMHILFRNWIALALTFPGGILFARRYLDTRSLCISSLEHALYGCFLFTIGLGQFFYVRVV